MTMLRTVIRAGHVTGLPSWPALDRWRHETRRAGWAAWITPVVIAVCGGGFLALLGAVHGPLGRTAGSLLEAVIPLGAAICVAGLAGGDPAIELQLSLPTRYRTTLARRYALVAGSASLVAVVFSEVLAAAGAWSAPTGALAGQLTWLVPLLVLCGVAAAVASLTASGRAAAAVVSALWTAEEWFKEGLIGAGWSRALYLFATARADQPPFLVRGQLTGAWLVNRGVLLAVCPLLLATAYAALRRPDRLLSRRTEP
ncbi:MAG: hypothetical protein ACRDNF_26915 [Streptosporangiaceae bacterium]